METILRPNRASMLNHLKWVVDPARATHSDLRFEVAHGPPERGPSCGRTFRLDEIDRAADFAASINSKRNNVYVGATLKRADTPAKGRTAAEHAALATCVPVDIDRDFAAGSRTLGTIATPQLLVVTGQTPELRGQLWIGVVPTEEVEVWSEVNRRVVAFSNGDTNALGPYRLMRLAGTISFPSPQKQARGYIDEVTAVYPHKGPTYAVRDLLQRFPSVTRQTTSGLSKNDTKGGSTALLGNNIDDRPPLNRINAALIGTMLDALPDEFAIERDTWLRVAFALHYFDDGDIGLALWKHFSDRCRAKAAVTDFEALWAGIGRGYEGRKITLGWLCAKAKEHGWHAPWRWDRSTKIVS